MDDFDICFLVVSTRRGRRFLHRSYRQELTCKRLVGPWGARAERMEIFFPRNEPGNRQHWGTVYQEKGGFRSTHFLWNCAGPSQRWNDLDWERYPTELLASDWPARARITIKPNTLWGLTPVPNFGLYYSLAMMGLAVHPEPEFYVASVGAAA